MIAIVAAMSEEIAPLVARARGTRVVSPPEERPFRLVTADLGGHVVALAVTGDGERNARRGAEALGSMISLHRLIVVGIAGAASGDLSPGALVVADEVRDEAGGVWHADAPSVAQAVRAGARAVRLVSASRIADSAAAKRGVALRAGAAGASVAVDLESAAYVDAAARARVPWTVLRVISDAAHEELPSLLNDARDEGGSVRRGAVALGLLRDWAALPVLLRMRARLRAASATLADTVERVLREP